MTPLPGETASKDSFERGDRLFVAFDHGSPTEDTMTRYRTTITEGTVYVVSASDTVEIGDVEVILDRVGGPSWTVSYSESVKQNYSELDTSDEGLTVDVIDAIHAMTFDEAFVEGFKAQPAEQRSDDPVSPRLGLFVGRLLGNLVCGVR